MNFEETVIAVRLAGQQAFQLLFLGNDDQAGDGRLGLGNHIRVAFHLAKLDQPGSVIKFGLQRGDHLDLALQPVLFAHGLLGLGLIIPEITLGAERFKLFQALAGHIKINMLSQQLDCRGDGFDMGLGFSLHGSRLAWVSAWGQGLHGGAALLGCSGNAALRG